MAADRNHPDCYRLSGETDQRWPAEYSECMRSHGITNFPDPQSHNGTIGIGFTPGGEFNPNNSFFQAAQKACQKLNPLPP